MALDPTVFKAYDVRGIYPEELDEDGAYRVGRAYGEVFEPRRIAVGRDMRVSSPAMAEAVRRGAADAGVDVLDVGMVGTEMVYFAVGELDLDGGIAVSLPAGRVARDRAAVGRPDAQAVEARPALAEADAELRLDPGAGRRVGIPRGDRLDEAAAGRRLRADRLADEEGTAGVVVAALVAAGRIGIAASVGGGRVEPQAAVLGRLHAVERPAGQAVLGRPPAHEAGAERRLVGVHRRRAYERHCQDQE